MSKDVVDILRLQSVVDANLHASRGSNSIYGIEKAGSVGSKNTHVRDVVLPEEVGEAASAVSEFRVCADYLLAVGSNVDNCWRLRKSVLVVSRVISNSEETNIRLYHRRPREKVCGRELGSVEGLRLRLEVRRQLRQPRFGVHDVFVQAEGGAGGGGERTERTEQQRLRGGRRAALVSE